MTSQLNRDEYQRDDSNMAGDPKTPEELALIAGAYAGRKRLLSGDERHRGWARQRAHDLHPRLTTPRLLLREFRTADFDEYAENMADPEATKFLSGTTDRRTAWRMFSAAAGYGVLQGAGWWAIESKETGQVVGDVGARSASSRPLRDRA